VARLPLADSVDRQASDEDMTCGEWPWIVSVSIFEDAPRVRVCISLSLKHSAKVRARAW
jgi:hypothetical protein